MPYCDPCARHWTPTSMRPDGTCPTCGQALELRRPLRLPAPADPAGDQAAEDPEVAEVKAPWHFKVLLVGLIVYLAWRGVQGLDWLVDRL